MPTLWMTTEIQESLEKLNSYSVVTEIIIINNAPDKQTVDFSAFGPQVDHLSFDKYNKTYKVSTFGKFKIITPPENAYVTESWNVGVSVALSEVVCIINDDVVVTEDTFNLAASTINESIGIVGLHENCFRNTENKPDIIPVTKRENGFGCCMFILKEKYKEIPMVLRIWFNDDYLFRHVEGQHLSLIGAAVKGGISKTVNNPALKAHIKQVIEEDFAQHYKILANER